LLLTTSGFAEFGNIKKGRVKCFITSLIASTSELVIASIMLTLICNTNTTLCAGCPENVVITLPDLSSYTATAGDELTCSSDGYPAPTYKWTVDGVDGSTTSTQALQEGDHEYECTATVTYNGQTCSETDTLTVIAYSKYQKQYNTFEAVLMLIALSVV